MNTSPSFGNSLKRQLPLIIGIAGFVTATNSESLVALVIGITVGVIAITYTAIRSRQKAQSLSTPRLAIGQLVQTASPTARPVWLIGGLCFLAMGLVGFVLFSNDPTPVLLGNAMIGVGLAPAFIIPLFPRRAIALSGLFCLCFAVGGSAFLYAGVTSFTSVAAETTSAAESNASANDSTEAAESNEKKADPVVSGVKHCMLGSLMLIGSLFPLWGLIVRALKGSPAVQTFLFDEGFYTPRGFVSWSQVQNWTLDRATPDSRLVLECQGTLFSASVPSEKFTELETLLATKVPR